MLAKKELLFRHAVIKRIDLMSEKISGIL